MNKAFRQGQILKLIRSKRILTQEDLARELKQSQGIDTTQVTLSRDIRELGLLKTPEGYRQVAAAPAGPDVAAATARAVAGCARSAESSGAAHFAGQCQRTRGSAG